MNLEIRGAYYAQRSIKISQAKGIQIPHGRLDVWNLRGYAADASILLPKISERIAQNYSLVILDPIYKILGGRDENAAGQITELLNTLERLAVESNAAVVFGHHYSKGNQSAKDAIDRGSGSGAWGRDPDAIVTLTRHEEDDAYSFEATLRDRPPLDPFVLRWNHPLMQRDGSLDPAKLKQARGRQKVYDAVQLLEVLGADGMSSSDWQAAAKEETGMGARTFYRLSRELKNAKRVVQSPPSDLWIKA